MNTKRLILTLLAFAFALAPQSPTTAVAERNRQRYSAKLISPKAGDVLHPGSVVRVEWVSNFPEVDLTMCETELLLSLDGGRTFSFITSQRNPEVHYFDWTVPRAPTRNAVLDIRFGCLGLYPETSSPQAESSFVISSM
jgi:hypothetical protein